MGLRTILSMNVEFEKTDVRDTGTRKTAGSLSGSRVLNDGVGNNKANEVFDDTRTLAANANEELDLAGVLLNPAGVAITFTRIKAIAIKADAANAAKITVGGAASNPFTGPFGATGDLIDIQPGDMFMITNANAGWTVTAGTGDKLKITNGSAAAAANYSIVLIGEV